VVHGNSQGKEGDKIYNSIGGEWGFWGDFLFFEHVHPEKVLKNRLQVRDKNLGRIKLSSTSSDGDTREKRTRERDTHFVAVQWQITFSQADNIAHGR
jgi:hypothetical protein